MSRMAARSQSSGSAASNSSCRLPPSPGSSQPSNGAWAEKSAPTRKHRRMKALRSRSIRIWRRPACHRAFCNRCATSASLRPWTACGESRRRPSTTFSPNPARTDCRSTASCSLRTVSMGHPLSLAPRAGALLGGSIGGPPGRGKPRRNSAQTRRTWTNPGQEHSTSACERSLRGRIRCNGHGVAPGRPWTQRGRSGCSAGRTSSSTTVRYPG